MNSFQEEIGKIIHDISNKREKIKDDFIRAYLSHLMSKIPVEDILDKIRLVETWSNDRLTVKWHFEIKE